MSRFKSKLLRWILPCLAALVPCALLIDPDHFFQGDGEFHLWFIAYVADYLHFHWQFPLVLNSPAEVGNTAPMLYGTLFFPLAAIPAQLLGAAGSIRLLAYLVFLIQIQSVRGLIRRIGGDSIWGWAIALSSAWAIYPLTNLYSRSALPEFFGAGFVFIGIVWFLSGGLEPAGKTKNRLVIGALIAGTFGAGTHPITAYLTVGVLPVVVLVYLVRSPHKWTFAPGKCLGAALLCLGLLAPWMNVMLKFGDRLDIRGAYPSLRTFEFDRLWVRLSPLPVDPRTFSAPVESVQTPYCDTQISIGIALAFLVIFAFNFKRMSAAGRIVGVLIFLVALSILAISVNPALSPALDHQLRIAQFCYRLVTPVNWLFFLGTVLSIAPALTEKSRPLLPWLAVALIGIAAIAVTIKLNHATAVMSSTGSSLIGPSHLSSDQHRDSPVNFFSNARDYCVHYLPTEESETPPLPVQSVSFNTGQGSTFGNVLPARVTVTETTRVQTNLLLHPWNLILVDGIPAASARLYEGRVFMTDVVVDAGSHSLSYEFRPTQRYRITTWLRNLCAIALLILVVRISF